MTVRDELLASVRAVLLGVTSAADGEILYGGVPTPGAPRPAGGYLLVTLSAGPIRVGTDEEVLDGSAEPPTVTMRGHWRATVSVQAYGETARGYLYTLSTELESPTSVDLQVAQGVVLRAPAGVRELSDWLQVSPEVRAGLDLEATFKRSGTAHDRTRLQDVQATTTLRRYEGQSDTLSATLDLLDP